MEYLTRDPIIEAYFNLRNTNEEDVPVFSETVLRLAVKQVLQFKNQREDDILSMYRALMTTMLHFNNGKSLDELAEIMICYNKDDIIKILDDTENIEDSWQIFTVEEMMYFIRKNAFFIIMSEWRRRFTRLYGKSALTDEKLGDMTLGIHDYFNWPVKSVHQWKRSFESKFLKGKSKEFNDHDVFEVTETDLSINKITADLGDKLHPLIDEDNLRDFVSSIKSIDGETYKLMEKVHIFKRGLRRQKEETTPQASPLEKVKVEEQTIEMFIKSEVSVEKKPQIIATITDDDDVEYVHVMEITDDEEDNMNIKKQSAETDDESEDDDEAETKDFTIVQDNTDETKATPEREQSTCNDLVNDEQATKYLSALQAYAVVNGIFEAIGLLDQVDSIFRARLEKET